MKEEMLNLTTGLRNPSDLDLLLVKDSFKDFSILSDKLISKCHPRAPHLSHDLTKELIWNDGSYNSCWDIEEHRIGGLHPLASSTQEEEDDDGNQSCVGSTKHMPRKAKGIYDHVREREKEKEEEEEEEEMDGEFRIISSSIGEITDDPRALVALLKTYAKQKLLHRGTKIHAAIVRHSLLEKNVFVGNALVNMYAKCGLLAKAQEVCNELPNRTVVSWNVLIAGYAQHGYDGEALHCFERMQLEGFSPDAATFASILKVFGSMIALDKGQEIHAQIVREGLLEKDMVLGTALVDMYAKCGSLVKAQELFNNLSIRDVVSWNVLIAGYAQHGQGEDALVCFQRMQRQGLFGDVVTFVCVLKGCGSIGAACKGQEIHAEIVMEGLLEKNLAVGQALVDMYAKCGLLLEAQHVFDNLPVQDVGTFSALIAGYAQCGDDEEALHFFELMQLEGLFPDKGTFVRILKACGSIGAVDKGGEVHAQIARGGLLEKDLVVGTALVDMYAKFGLLEKAQEVFDKLPSRNVVLFGALIGGYAQHGHGKEALRYFEQMELEGLSPDAITYVCILKACVSIGAVDKGQDIHAQIVKDGLLEKEVVVGSALIDLYAKFGLLGKAKEVLDKLPVRTAVSFSALIAGYAQYGLGEEALDCFKRMQLEGLPPDAIILACVLKACASIGMADKGKEVHAQIVKNGLLETDNVVGSGLVDMYAKCGLLAEAQEVFDKLPAHNVVSSSALIAGYVQHGHDEDALKCFEQMQLELLSPDAVTFACILKACGNAKVVQMGQKVHSQIVKEGLLDNDITVANGVVDMYVKCGLLAEAKDVFDKLPERSVLSWNMLIGGYALHERAEEALSCFEQMQLEGLAPDAFTFVCILKVCASIGRPDKGEDIHAHIAKDGLLEGNAVVGTALVDMYAKCGSLAKAQEVFDNLPVRDVVSWSALVSGYGLNGQFVEAIKYFEQMQCEGVAPNAVTFVSIMKVCGSTGAAYKGKEIHAQIVKERLLEEDIVVSTAVVDMYAKCGLLAKAQEFFDNLPFRNVVMWNVLMAGYAQFGKVDNVFNAFDKLMGEGLQPDMVTLTHVLNTCSHGGLLQEAQTYFETMSTSYGLIPTVEHHNCMIDLFGRAGHLDKVGALIKELPFSATPTVWHTVLSASRRWENMQLGRLAFKHAAQFDQKDAAAYICYSNIHTAADSQVEAGNIQVKE